MKIVKTLILELDKKIYKKLYSNYTLGPDYGLQSDLKHARKTYDDKSFALLAYSDDEKQLLGWAGVFYMFHDDPRPWIEFYIKPKYRGKGYATLLLEALPKLKYRFTAYSKTSYQIAKALKRIHPKTDIYMWYEYKYLKIAKELHGI